jgi:predicted kinase
VLSGHYPVLLVTGPAGAGKTTAADRWARRQRQPAIHLSLDDVRDLVKSGYANPEDGTTPEMWRQLALARDACAQIAKLYVASGFCCVIDDAVFPRWPEAGLDAWVQALRPLSCRLAVVLPRFDVIVGRNRVRTGHRRLREETLRVIYDEMQRWRDEPDVDIFEHSEATPDEVAAWLTSIASGGPAGGETADV